jgi:hypothetical protein
MVVYAIYIRAVCTELQTRATSGVLFSRNRIADRDFPSACINLWMQLGGSMEQI